VLAQKGGAGKTTLTLHWAVAAERRHKPVAVIDTDTQASAAAWYRRRTQETPQVLQAGEDNVRDAVAACERAGVRLALIDTMPRVEKPSAEAARVADLVVIPCGPSVIDIEAIGATIGIVERVGKRAVIVLNQGRPGSSINAQAEKALSGYGLPICPVHIMRRASLADAFTDGRAVMELEPGGKAAAEILASWSWIEKQLKR
jgi:chromosome partitioning protein